MLRIVPMMLPVIRHMTDPAAEALSQAGAPAASPASGERGAQPFMIG
jgi:hypothetical protein